MIPLPARTARMGGLLVLYLSWGSTYSAMRVALRSMPPLLLLSGRCLLAGAILYAIARRRGSPHPDRVLWLRAAVIGGLVLGAGHGLTTWAIQHVDSGLAAILGSMVSVWLALLSWSLLRERPTGRTVAGFLLGFAGLSLVVSMARSGGTDLPAVGALVVAPIAWSFGSVLSRRTELPSDPIMATAAQLLACAPILAVIGSAGGELTRFGPDASSATALAAFAYLSIGGYVAGFSAYTWLLRVESISTVATYAYVTPLVAVVLGATLLGEPLTVSVVVGGGVILAGVALVVLDRGDGQYDESRARVEQPSRDLERANPHSVTGTVWVRGAEVDGGETALGTAVARAHGGGGGGRAGDRSAGHGG